MEEQLISVVVPVYNAGQYVEKCIRSIMSQTYGWLEILVVDDGSCDGSTQICRKLASEDERITFISKKNEGVVRARNVGIELAQGKFIAFVDADDWVEEDFYKNMIDEIADFDLLTTSYVRHQVWGTNHVPEIYQKTEYRTHRQMEWFWKNMMLEEGKVALTPYLWNKLFRRELVDKMYKKVNTAITYAEDAVFLYLYLLQCSSLKISRLSGYHYYERENTAATSKNPLFLYNVNDVYLCLLKEYSTHYLREELNAQLQGYILRMLRIQLSIQEFKIQRFYYPWFGRLDGMRVALYGAGEVGRTFYKWMMQDEGCELVLWVDKRYEELQGEGLSVASPEELQKVEPDCIVVAVFEEKVYLAIREELKNMGMEESRILWSKTKLLP